MVILFVGGIGMTTTQHSQSETVYAPREEGDAARTNAENETEMRTERAEQVRYTCRDAPAISLSTSWCRDVSL
jgi:hypothetical protein